MFGGGYYREKVKYVTYNACTSSCRVVRKAEPSGHRLTIKQ
jgi:hypothetical protein